MIKATRMILLLAASIGSMAAGEPRPPTGRWVVNYDDAQCVASRNYGTDDKPLYLGLKPSPSGTVLRLLLIRPGPAMEAEQRPASIRFDGRDSMAATALVYGDRGAKRIMASINLPMAQFAANRLARSIAIKAGPFDEQLLIPGLSGVMAAFDDCLSNLRDVWNIDAINRQRVAKAAQPRRPLRNLFNSGSYPEQAMRQNETGRVGIAMLIDETGKVSDCMIEETSGIATLDTMTCLVITANAKFEPAVGTDGKPVKSAYFHRISWRIAA